MHLKCRNRAAAVDPIRGNCQPDHNSIGKYTSTSTTTRISPQFCSSTSKLITLARISKHLWFTNAWSWWTTLILPCTSPILLHFFITDEQDEEDNDGLLLHSAATTAPAFGLITEKTILFWDTKPISESPAKSWQGVCGVRVFVKSAGCGGGIFRTVHKKPQSLWSGIEFLSIVKIWIWEIRELGRQLFWGFRVWEFVFRIWRREKRGAEARSWRRILSREDDGRSFENGLWVQVLFWSEGS